MTQRAFIVKGSAAIVALAVLFIVRGADAATLRERLSGQILLQVESNGEAWYVEPTKGDRWYLGRPADAFAVMRRLGLGISNANLAKISVAGDAARGDARLTTRMRGRILLQVESNGEAWYVFPRDGRRYALGKPDDAFHVMRRLGLGISNANLSTIPIAVASAPVIAAPRAPEFPTQDGAEQDSGVGTPTSAQPSAPPPETAPTPLSVLSQPAVAVSAFRTEMLALINAERRLANAPDLLAHDAIHTAAQRLTDDMVARNYFAVTTPEGLGGNELLKEAGYESRATGVLIAGGPSDAATAFGLWNGSESSKAIVVKSDFEDMGVGVTRGSDNRNIWVVFFASSQVRYEQQIAAALSDMEAMRQAMLVRVNEERVKQNLPTLVLNPLLNESAQKKSEDMFTKDYFEHASPEGVTPHQLITSTGYPARISAENLAKDPRTVDEVMTGWMASPGHRANILFDGITEAGFGLRLGRNASGFHIFWTQHFGKR